MLGGSPDHAAGDAFRSRQQISNSRQVGTGRFGSLPPVSADDDALFSES